MHPQEANENVESFNALIEENKRLKARIAVLERERDDSDNANVKRYLSALYRSAADLIKHRSLETLLHTVIEDMNELVGTTHGIIYLGDENQSGLIARAATGIFKPYIGAKFRLSEGVSGEVFQIGKPMLIDDYQQWNTRDEPVLSALKAAVSFPLKIGNQPTGVITFAFLEYNHTLTDSTMELLQGYANLAAICMENTRIYDELTRTKHFNERVTNIAPVTIILYDAMTIRPVYVNDAIQRILGYTPDEILQNGDNILPHLIAPEDIERLQKHIQAVLLLRDDEIAVQINYRIRHKDGSWRDFRSQDRIFDRNPDGSPARIISLGQDVTQTIATQQALIKSENRLRAIFESAAVGITVINSDGIIQDCNPAFATMLGYTRDELIGINGNDISHLDDIRKEIPELRRMAAEQLKQVSVEKRYMRKNGSVMWARVWFSSISSPSDVSTSGIAIIEDITERKQAEHALIDSESRFRTIFDSAAVGIVLSDRQGNVLEVNPAFCAMLGYTITELRENQYAILTHPDDLVIEEKQIAKLISKQIENFTLEKRYFAKDGHIVWTRVWYSLLPQDDSRGVAIIEDMTERKLAEQAMMESESRFRTLMETFPAIVFLYQNNSLVYINPAADYILGRSGLKTFQEMLVQIVSDNQILVNAQSYDLHLTLENGNDCWLNLSLTMIELEGIPTILGTALDVTARKQAEQHEIAFKLEQHRVNLLAEFVAHASHDFRTPLSTIQTSLYLIERLQDEERRQQRIQIIKGQVEQLNRMLDNMLTLTRLDSSAYFNPAKTNTHEILLTVKDKAQSAIEKKSQQFEVDIPEDQYPLFADASLMISALFELVDNAIRYTEEGGKIAIRCKTDNDHCQFTVTDSGIGIPSEDSEQIFERFYRVDRARRSSGTGLGLTIVKKIAERHGGTVMLEQSTLDEGSTFSLTIPLASAAV